MCNRTGSCKYAGYKYIANKVTYPPPIVYQRRQAVVITLVLPYYTVVRFTSRDIRNQIYANRKKIRFADLRNFLVSDTKNIFVNENLTSTRKQLFWKTQQQVKNNSWKYIWTHNGNVFVKKDNKAIITAIKNELDLNLTKK